MQMWVQGGHGTWGNAYPPRLLSFEFCSLPTNVLYTGLTFMPRVALSDRHDDNGQWPPRRPLGSHFLSYVPPEIWLMLVGLFPTAGISLLLLS